MNASESVRNAELRYGAMREIWIGRKVRYDGQNRHKDFGNRLYEVIDIRFDGSAVLLDAPGVANPWVGVSSVIVFQEPEHLSEEEIFTAAVGGERAKLDAEIARLEARLAELKAARTVLDSL